ncbi:MAG: hypothetical protein E7374_02485 [Clostridiales bacterium]|nr:hypothetical protein [Clostridiales bacterium]
MLNRDFTKSNKDYLSKNKITLIAVLVFLIAGLLCGLAFGFKKNFEMGGYNEVTVEIGEVTKKEQKSMSNKVEKIIKSYNADLDTISVYDEGDNAKLVVRYLNDLSDKKEAQINTKIADKLEIEITKISEHTEVDPAVKTKDFVFTAVSILIIAVIATIFAWFRYNSASAITTVVACGLGTLGFMSFATILRLSIGLNYLAMIVALNVLTIFIAFNLFEELRSSSLLHDEQYSNALSSAMKKIRTRAIFITLAIMLFSILLVIIAPSVVKYTSLNLLFLAVTFAGVILHVIPFVWSMLITHRSAKKLNIKKEN